MFALFGELFSYSFLVRALIVGSLVALCAALLGVSLVLKRYSMIGDGLSHVGFGALSIAMAMNAAPLAVAIPVVIVAAFLLLRISQNSRLGGDSAIALISSGALWDSEEETTLSSFKKAEELPPDSPCPLQPESAVTAISNTAAAKAIFLKRIINLLNLYFGFKAHKP